MAELRIARDSETDRPELADSPNKAKFQEVPESILKPKPRFKEVPKELIPEEKNYAQKLLGQAVAGVDDIVGLAAKPLQRTFGDIIYTPEGGWQAIGPEEATRRQEEGTLPSFPGKAKGDPEDAFQAGARMFGQTAMLGPIAGRLAGAIKPVKTIADTRLGRVKQFPQKLGNQMGERFKQQPIRTTVGDAGLGFTAGMGGHVASQIFPDSSAAKFVGEIVGGIAPQFLIVRLAAKAAGLLRQKASNFFHPLSDSGQLNRAKGRVNRAIPEENLGKSLDNINQPTTIDPATGKPVLTITQRTNEPGLLSLEESIADSSELLLREHDLQIANANKVIQAALRDVSGEGDESARAIAKTLQLANQYLDDLLATRIRIAAQTTSERVEQLGTSVTREQTNRIAREEIESALKAARAQEKELYKLIDPKVKAPFKKTLAKIKELKKELSRAEQGDMASVANIILNLSKKRKSKDGVVSPAPTLTTIKELRGVQKKLRQFARNARAGENANFNAARIADKVADEITEDLADIKTHPEMVDAIQAAVAFSRNLHDRFSKGAVGKLLGKNVAGGEKVPAGETLERTIGLKDTTSREAMDDLLRIFDFPDASIPGRGLVIDAAEDYMRGRFLVYAVHKGELNVKNAERFIAQHIELISRLPVLRHQLDEIIESGHALAIQERNRKRIHLDDPKVSKATMYIEKGAVAAFKDMAQLKPEEAVRQMQLLINRVAKDKTGEATKGLKSGFMEYLLQGARSGKGRDVKDIQFLSGVKLKEAINNPANKAMIEKLFDKQELARLEIITRDLIRLEHRIAAGKSLEGVIGDKPGTVIMLLAGIAGAASGRRMGNVIGGTIQVPGMIASRFRQLAESNVRDPVTRLLRDAMHDEKLFRALLEPVDVEVGLSKTTTSALNAWAFNVLAENGGVYDESEDELQ